MDEVRILGLDELQRQLRTLPEKIEKNVMRGALRAGAQVMRKDAQSRVPVRTGALKKSIRISFERKSMKYGWLRAHVKAGNKDAWYAHLIEYGTASYYTGSGKSVGGPYEIRAKEGKSLFFAGLFRESVMHPGIHPQPFMRPAFDVQATAAIDAFAAYVRRRLPLEIERARAR